jgi:hypothetical protein
MSGFSKTLLIAVGIFLISLGLHLQFGFGWDLDRDAALYSYAGRIVAEGRAPYEAVFDVKGPYASIIPALGVWISDVFDVRDLIGIRAQFMVLSALTVVGVFLLGKELARSIAVGLLAGASFMGFQGFLYQAAGGGRPKTAVVMLLVFGLLAALRRRWLTVGVLSTLGVLTWQPMVFLWGAAGVAGLSESTGRKRAVGFLLLGSAVVVGVTVVYFWYHNAVLELFQGTISVLFSIDRDPQPLVSHVLHPLHAMWDGFQASYLVLTLGFVAVLAVAAERFPKWRHSALAFAQDRWMPFFTTFLLFIGWSLIDFQGYDDGFPLLPHLAIGFGVLLNWCLARCTALSDMENQSLQRVGLGLLFIALIFPIAIDVKFNPGTGLEPQQEAVEQMMDKLGDGRLLALDAPEVLVLGDVDSVSRHVVIMTGIDQFIDKTETGGFEGWIADLDNSEIDMVVWQAPQGRHIPKLRKWVVSEFRPWRELETWEVFIRE